MAIVKKLNPTEFSSARKSALEEKSRESIVVKKVQTQEVYAKMSKKDERNEKGQKVVDFMKENNMGDAVEMRKVVSNAYRILCSQIKAK